MPETFLETSTGRRLAYNLSEGSGPGVVFLGGFASDKAGSKALFLEDYCRKRGRAYLRFDYSGHGTSSGAFTDGAIGDWAEDAYAALSALTQGPQVIVGSSMGGWISLLLAKRCPERFAGLVTIAAAPDFTEDSMWSWMDDAQKTQLLEEGAVELPSDYGAPYTITRRLIEEARDHLVLRTQLSLPMPVRMLQGSADTDVDQSVALRLLAHVAGDNIRLEIVKGADHRFSEPPLLALIAAKIEEVLADG
ncbi:MAG: alpha/beta hydrolase [Pseudomonadota bacterium]